MIDIQNLTVSFTKEYDALHNINLQILEGEKIALIGDADSGKTTFLRCIARLQPLSSGEIFINSTPIKKVNFKQDVSLGYVPKVPVFKDKKSVLSNLQYVLKIRGYDEANSAFKIISCLKTFGIDGMKNVPVKNLTYKQKMLVQLARVSLRKVDIVLIDNITKNLVKDEQTEIINAIKTLMEINPNTTFIMAFDNEKIAKELDLKILKLKLGSIQ